MPFKHSKWTQFWHHFGGVFRHSKGTIWGTVQAPSRRPFQVSSSGSLRVPYQSLFRRHLRCASATIQAPFRQIWKHRFQASFEVPLEAPFVASFKHHWRHRSNTIRAPFWRHHWSVIFRRRHGRCSYAVQADWRRCKPRLPCAADANKSSATSNVVFRRSRQHAGTILQAFQMPLRSAGFGHCRHPLRRRVGATDSHHYGVVLTLILVIEGGVMASFGGVSLPATRRWLRCRYWRRCRLDARRISFTASKISKFLKLCHNKRWINQVIKCLYSYLCCGKFILFMLHVK